MWENSRQEFIVVSHPKNTFTSNTLIELMAGDYVMESGNTRTFSGACPGSSKRTNRGNKT